MNQILIPESPIGASDDNWIPIDDSLGIWTELRQGTSCALEANDQQDPPRQESSPIHNRPEFHSSKERLDMMTPTLPSSLVMEAASDNHSATMETKQPKAVEEPSQSSPSTLAPSETVNLKRTASGKLWTGIRAAEHNSLEEVEAVISDQDASEVDESQATKALGPIQEDDVHHRQGHQQQQDPVRDDATKESSVYQDTHHKALASRAKSSALLDPFQALLYEIIPFNFLFGSSSSKPEHEPQHQQPQQEVPQETMGLRNNVNAEIALGLTTVHDSNRVVVSSAASVEESFFARLGYAPGMQVVKVNGQDVGASMTLDQVYSQMELHIQAMDDRTKLVKNAIFTVKDQKMDLYVHKTKGSKDIFITKVEPHSLLDQAGFQEGMRVVRVNGRSCPGSFWELANLLTADIVAIPPEIALVESNKTISNLTLPPPIVVPEDEEPEEQQIVLHNGPKQYQPSSNPLLDLLQVATSGGGLNMITNT